MSGNSVAIGSIFQLLATVAIMLGGLALMVGARRWAARLLAVGFSVLILAPLVMGVLATLPAWLVLLVAVVAVPFLILGSLRVLVGQRSYLYIRNFVLAHWALRASEFAVRRLALPLAVLVAAGAVWLWYAH